MCDKNSFTDDLDNYDCKYQVIIDIDDDYANEESMLMRILIMMMIASCVPVNDRWCYFCS